MYIEKIHISNFGKFVQEDYSFSKGITLIEGKNESGKTTFASFLKFMLYGFSDQDAYRQSNTIGGTMTVNWNGQSYRMERECHFEKDAFQETVQIRDCATNALAFPNQQPWEVFLGIPEEIFACTAYFGQTEPIKMSSTIENLLFSVEEDVNPQKAIQNLEEAQLSLYENDHKGGKIFELEKERDALEVRFSNAQKGNTEILLKESSLQDLQYRYTENKARLEKIEEQFQHPNESASAPNLEKKTVQIQSQLQEIVQQNTYQNFMPDENYSEKLATLSYKIKDVEKKCAYLEDKIQTMEEEKSHSQASQSFSMNHSVEELDLYQMYHEKRAVMRMFGGILCALAVLTGVLAAFLLFWATGAATILIVAAVVLLALVVVCLTTAKKQTVEMQNLVDEEELKIQSSQNEPDENNWNIQTEWEEQNQIRKECIEQAYFLLAQWGKPIPESDLANYLKRIAMEAENFHHTIQQLSHEYEKIEVANAVSSQAAEQANFSNLKREQDFLKKATEALQTKMNTIEQQLSVLYPSVEDPARIYTQMSALQQKIVELKKSYAACQLALEKMVEARDTLRENVLPRLSEYAGTLMQTLTDGKYTTLGIRKNMNLSLFEGKKELPLASFGRGIQDVVSIGFRFALIPFLYRKTTPPVIFDESFVRLDEERLKNMFHLLKKLEESDLQIFVLTSQKREALLLNQLGISPPIVLM